MPPAVLEQAQDLGRAVVVRGDRGENLSRYAGGFLRRRHERPLPAWGCVIGHSSTGRCPEDGRGRRRRREGVCRYYAFEIR